MGNSTPNRSTDQSLLDWYRSNRRDLPWRRTCDAYAIWVSEVMLQQTQVATVIDFWLRWMNLFPTVEHLAKADEQTVLAAWQGLGYYRRCRLLHSGARWVAQHGFPATVEEWRQVPGVGPYTAGAIASIAQKIPTPLVDGNVERVYARLYSEPATGSELNRNAWKWADQVLDRCHPGDWNQALMELGATICVPINPMCDLCPFQSTCKALSEGRVEDFPVSAGRPKIVALAHACVAPIWEGKVGIRQIAEGAWWQGMWEFPRATQPDIQELVAKWPIQTIERLGTVRHTVTHHRIELTVWSAHLKAAASGLTWLKPAELSEIPMPSPQRKALGIVSKHCF